MKKSYARTVILEELNKLKTHPRGDELFEIVRNRLPKVSMGTVYRNLDLLRREGLIVEQFCGDFNRYDGDTSLHSHFLCRKCQRLWDFNKEGVQGNVNITGSPDFHVEKYYVIFHGLCRWCSIMADVRS